MIDEETINQETVPSPLDSEEFVTASCIFIKVCTHGFPPYSGASAFFPDVPDPHLLNAHALSQWVLPPLLCLSEWLCGPC